MYQLKQMLNDIVDIAFANDTRIKSYKAFYIEVLDKVYKSKHGDYNPSERKIRLMNPYREEDKLIITAIHELAHHINHMQKNPDIHGKGFYANYERLLHAALDMKLFDKNDYIRLLRESKDAVDENKVKKMIQNYRPVFNGYKDDKNKIIVFGGFDIKETLKNKGFSYNKISKAWEKEAAEQEIEELKKYFDDTSVKYKITGANKYITKDDNSKKHLIVVYNAFTVKDSLKEHHFRYRSSDQAWYIDYDGSQNELNDTLDIIRQICIGAGYHLKYMERYGLEYRITLI